MSKLYCTNCPNFAEFREDIPQGKVFCSKRCQSIGHRPGFYPNPAEGVTSEYAVLLLKDEDGEKYIPIEHLIAFRENPNGTALFRLRGVNINVNSVSNIVKQKIVSFLNKETFEIRNDEGLWIIPFKSISFVNPTQKQIILISGDVLSATLEEIDLAFPQFIRYYKFEGEYSPKNLWRAVEALWDAPGMPGANQELVDFIEEYNT